MNRCFKKEKFNSVIKADLQSIKNIKYLTQKNNFKYGFRSILSSINPIKKIIVEKTKYK